MTAASTYEPRGEMSDFMAALRAEPTRLFTMNDVATILHCKPFPSTIDQYLYAAIRAGLTFRINLRGEWLYAGREIDDDLLVASGRVPRTSAGVRMMPSPFTDEDRKRASEDPRAAKVDPTWSPPKMIATRTSAAPVGLTLEEEDDELRARISAANGSINESMRARRDGSQSDLGTSTTSAATASSHEIPNSASTPEPVAAAGPGQERHQAQDQHPAGSQERCAEVANEGDARVASGGCAQPDEEEEAVEFNAAVWLDGDVVVYGAQANEDGSFTLSAEQIAKLERLFEASKIATLLAGAVAGKAASA